VQVAYDERYIYVAFRCGYSGKRHRDDAYPIDGRDAAGNADSVSIAIDPLLDRANALVFIVTRSGGRVDQEVSAGGEATNSDWRGYWDVTVTSNPDEWFAEFRIPWGTLRLPAHDSSFSLGINFSRREPTVNEFALWSKPPNAGAFTYDPTFFGKLTDLTFVHPNLRLYLQPYVTAGFDQTLGATRSRLFDFTGTRGNYRAYAGVYARYTPPGPLRIEATGNPDFAGVPPDSAVANFNRFELFYPETRPFFTEDNPRFFFGDDDFNGDPVDPAAQLFYSRRVGLVTDPSSGATTSVPILYGGKAIYRDHGTEVSGMNVGLSSTQPKIEYADSVSLLRVNQSFGEGRRLGGIFMNRSSTKFYSGGIDGSMTLYDRRMQFDGFLAGSSSEKLGSGGIGELRFSWTSENLFVLMALLDTGDSFDGQLGYVPVTGARTTWMTVGYKQFLSSDQQKKLLLVAGLNDTRNNRNDALVYDHAFAQANLTLANGGRVSAQVYPANDNVIAPFKLFANRITVNPGLYRQMAMEIDVSTAVRLPVVGSISYKSGDLFAGQQRQATGEIDLNLGRLATASSYTFYTITYDAQELIGHSVAAKATYNYTPLARTMLIVQANTLIDRAVAQLVTTYTFGLLSTLSLIISKSTGAVPLRADRWFGSEAPFTALASFAFGMSPF
jgi:hypothetical protein